MAANRGVIPPIPALREAGCPIALGTDNNTNDVFEVMRIALLTERIRRTDAFPGAQPRAARGRRGGEADLEPDRPRPHPPVGPPLETEAQTRLDPTRARHRRWLPEERRRHHAAVADVVGVVGEVVREHEYADAVA